MDGELTAAERDRFFRDVLGVTDPAEPIRERRNAAFDTFSLGGRPVGWKAEHSAAHLALPPGLKRLTPDQLAAYFAKQRTRIDQLEAGATRLDDLTN
jgi:hypothetical protein